MLGHDNVRGSPKEEVERFIELLCSRARYGLRGEKPLAVIATLQYLCENRPLGARLVELVEMPRHSRYVRHRFADLADQYGEIVSSSSSWGMIIGKKELQRAVHQQRGVDEAFASLSQEQACLLFERYVRKLKEQVVETRPRAHITGVRLGRQAESSELGQTVDGDYYVLEPTPGRESVHAWSGIRLPFEPEGWLKDLRTAICTAVRKLHCNSDEVLYGAYASRVGGLVDVENVLFYNVGPGCFANSARWGLRFERVLSQPPLPPQPLSGSDLHYHHYTLASRTASLVYWIASRTLARWNGIECDPVRDSTKPHAIWHSLKRGAIHADNRPEQLPTHFALRVILHAPVGSAINAAVVIKPVFDGIVAAFHQHDGSGEVEVGTRLAVVLGVEREKVVSLLRDGEFALLGRRRLVWPWRDGLQWNPGDDTCVAGELLLEDGASWKLSGELLEVRQNVRRVEELKDLAPGIRT